MKNMSKKIVAILLTLCILMSGMITAFAVEATSDDYAIYQDSSSATTNYDTYFHCYDYSTYGSAEKHLPAGEYTVTMDVYAQAIGDLVYKPIKDWANADEQKYWTPTEDDLNKWVTVTYTGTTTTGANLHTIIYCQGFKGYVDNITVYSGDTEIYTLSFTAAENGKAGHESNGAGVVGALPQDIADAKPTEEPVPTGDYVVLLDNSANTGFGQFYLHEVGMPHDKTYPVGDYTVKFDYYPLVNGSSKNIVAHLTATGWSGDAFPGTNGQKWVEVTETLGEWQTISFDITTIAEGQFPWFYVGAGMKGYFDNYQIIDKATGETVLDFSPVEADLGKTSKDTATVVEFAEFVEPDCVVLLDNSANTGFGQFYLHEVGMPHDKTYPIGDYTVKFDYYPIVNGSSKNIVAHLTATGWSGDAFPGTNGQKWVEVTETLGEWQTISFDITTIAEGQFPWFYVGAGMKGYFDNYQIIDKSTGETVLDFSPRLADLGKTSKDTATVVEFEEVHIHKAGDVVLENVVDATCKDAGTYDEVVYCTECGEELSRNTVTNDMLLIDTTANANNTPKDFWFNNLGMSGYGTLPNGTYTIQFDVYPVTIPDGGNLFHFRTGSGSGPSSDAGWWKPELTVGDWTTTSNTFTVKDGTTTGNHILYVYGGFKGCVDNLVILDADGNEVAGTRTGFTGLTVHNDYKDYLTISDKLAHTPGETKIENTVAADCVTNGSHDEVVYCTVCDAEISRNTVTDTAPGHQFTTVPEQPSTDCLTHGVAEHKHCSVCGYDYATGASSTEPFENALKAEDLQLPVADHTELKDNGKTVYAMTESGHAKVCAVCDEEFGFEGHTGDFVPNGASGHTGECITCGLELSAESGHNFNGDNVCDECDWTCTSHNFVDGDVINAGDCTTDKVVATYCTICGIAGENNVTTAPGHTPGTAVRENEVETSCKAPGSYDEVVYCTVETCKAELSRENKTIDQLPHTPGTPVRENEVGASCTAPGSYDEVVYCTVEDCKAELSRENKPIDQLAHTPGTPVRENEVGASCTAPGSYDEVVYCTAENCGAELSRENKPIDQLPHTPGSSWEENRVNDCINGNSYEIVTNCGVCFEEISRVEHTDEATGHDIYDYDEVSATCSWEGWNAHSQCLICGKHFEFGTTDKFSEDYISEDDVYTDVVADAHSWVEVEPIAPDYENEGKIGYKYCEYCNKFVYGDKELDLEIDYDALYEELDPLLNDAYDTLWEEFTAENPEPDENASDEEWNEFYAAFEELWRPVHDSIYMPAYIEALEAAAAAEGVEFEVAVLEKEDDNKDDSDADADNKQDGDTTDSTDDKTDNGSENKVDGDKSETSPITGEKLAVVVAALTAVIAAGFVLVFKAKKAY